MRGYIRTRRGPQGVAYQLAVYVGHDDDGRSRYLYETVHGPRREAERRLTELIGEVEHGIAGPNRRVAVAELDRTWWDASADDLSANTRIGYRGLLDRYLLPTFGSRRHHAVRTRARLLNDLVEQPHREWRLHHVSRQAAGAVPLGARRTP